MPRADGYMEAGCLSFLVLYPTQMLLDVFVLSFSTSYGRQHWEGTVGPALTTQL